ncbi:DUF1579 domain-containing protein [Actinoplanes siamensis]|uniref:DUF1579 domain-containing protein n=1 Tax=Actinoplanes siamensis TaxID=1223317 RepID=A0A919NDW8_9ACTN|nr:DUF1579 domain-containing protein [Actinoplanes siamensis]GIF09454.1 hypothetical protein Asi03nite_69920 [Actinoplanes siamensis]
MAITITFTRAAVTGAALLGAAVLSPALAHAAEPLGSPAEHLAEPVSVIEPLRTLTGSWSCTGSVTGVDGTVTRFETTSTAKFILDGKFMRWQEVNSIGGTPIGSAEYIWGWDAHRNQFTADRFDDAGQRGAQTTPGWAGNALTSTGVLIHSDGSSIPLSTTLTKTAKNAFAVRSVVQLGAGASVVSESACTR